MAANQSTGFLVSNNLPAADARGFVRFVRRSDSVFVQDTARHLHHRLGEDLAHARCAGLAASAASSLLLYKLPPTVDSNATFSELTAAFTPEAFLDTVEVPDTLLTGKVDGAVFAGRPWPGSR